MVVYIQLATLGLQSALNSISYIVSFPDPPVFRSKEGLVYKVGILGYADSAVVGKLRNKT